MEIILAPACASITGSFSKRNGYAIRRRGKRFFSVRPKRKIVQPDAHWQFIVTCAQLAKSCLYIADIRISRYELTDALGEAGYTGLTLGTDSPRNACPVLATSGSEFNAADVLSVSSFITSESNSDIKKGTGL